MFPRPIARDKGKLRELIHFIGVLLPDSIMWDTNGNTETKASLKINRKEESVGGRTEAIEQQKWGLRKEK